MPKINVSLKEGADEQEIQKAKQKVIDQGGQIVHEFTLFPGFTAEFPADSMHTLESNEHINVEADQEVRTQ